MKKAFLIIIFASLLSEGAMSQNLIQSDEKLLHFGFTLGLNTMDYGIKPSREVLNGLVYEQDITKLIPGFTVGVIGDLRLNNYLNLRLVPALHLAQRDLSYFNDANGEVKTINLKSNVLTIPLYLKYSSSRVNNYRPYLIGGGGIAFDFGREREKPLLLKQMDYFIDFGVGCTFYFTYFRFSPEIKFAMGFNDLVTPLSERPKDYISEDDKFYTQALSRLTSRLFTFTLNFE